jgi:O-antigen ligase
MSIKNDIVRFSQNRLRNGFLLVSMIGMFCILIYGGHRAIHALHIKNSFYAFLMYVVVVIGAFVIVDLLDDFIEEVVWRRRS